MVTEGGSGHRGLSNFNARAEPPPRMSPSHHLTLAWAALFSCSPAGYWLGPHPFHAALQTIGLGRFQAGVAPSPAGLHLFRATKRATGLGEVLGSPSGPPPPALPSPRPALPSLSCRLAGRSLYYNPVAPPQASGPFGRKPQAYRAPRGGHPCRAGLRRGRGPCGAQLQGTGPAPLTVLSSRGSQPRPRARLDGGPSLRPQPLRCRQPRWCW